MNTHTTPSNGNAADRRTSRQSMFLQSVLVLPDGSSVKARVRNLSATGMLVDCDRPIKVGIAVTTDLRGIGKIVGQTVWSSANRVGVAFNENVDPGLALKPSGSGTKLDESLPYYLRTLNGRTPK